MNSALFQLTPMARSFISLIFKLSTAPAWVDSLIYGVSDIILYSVSFILPVFFISKYAGQSDFHISLKPGITNKLPPLIIMSVGCITAVGLATNLIQWLLSHTGIHFHSNAPEVPHNAVGIILLFLSSAAVPAIVEEILFRKVILEKLMPYGKSFAVIISAFLFALMHNNPTQLFYAFTGGILLGITTLKTESIFSAIIIHFSNNTLAVLYLLLKEFAPSKVSQPIILGLDVLLSVLGVIFLITIIRKGLFSFNAPRNTEFSPYKGCIRLLPAVYIAYTAYLSARWVYFL